MFYKILALDGGGIRSIFTAELLWRLQDRFKILSRVDMLAGTSGGAIVAAGIASGWSPLQIVDFFAAEGPGIFEKRFPNIVGDVAQLNHARYAEKQRRRVFDRFFGNRLMTDSQRALVIPAYDVRHKSGRWQPVSFTNFPQSPLKSASLSDAVMCSTAAPIYFPVAEGQVEAVTSRWIDGGVWANNPADAAYSEAIREEHGGQNHRRIVVLSIGTTRGKMILKTDDRDLGLIEWYKEGLLDLILDAGAKDAVDYKMRNALGSRYYRLDLDLDKHIALDDTSKVSELIRLADSIDLEPVGQWLEGFWA